MSVTMFMIFKGVASHLLGLDIQIRGDNAGNSNRPKPNLLTGGTPYFAHAVSKIPVFELVFVRRPPTWMPTSFSWHIFYGPAVLAAGHVIAPFLLNPAFMANFSKKQAKPSDT